MIQLKDRKKCREGKKEERIATSGIGINQQVDLDSNKWNQNKSTSGFGECNKWKKVMQQVERRKTQQVYFVKF